MVRTNPVSSSTADKDSILATAIFLMTSKEHDSDLRAMCKIYSILPISQQLLDLFFS